MIMEGSPFDVAVIGLGAMGSAAAYHLARRGLRVVGLEQFTPAHDRGSSHGLTRVIRKAYFEHPDYVPLVLRAYELWAELEKESGRELYRKTGAFMIGRPDSPVVRGSLESARVHGLPHRMLSTADLRARFPFMRFRDDEVALEEFDAGVLFAEEAVLAMQDLARRRGADLRFGAPGAIGEPTAKKTIVTAGAWLPGLAPSLPLKVERQVLYWFDPLSDRERIPLFMWDRGGRLFYSIPDVKDHGVKVAFHHHGEITAADRLRRDVGADEIEDMRRRLAETVPPMNGPLRKSAVCMYTNTPDEHFAIGVLPSHPGVIVGSPCSGHGFKFAPVVGEILADLAVSGSTRHPISLFSLDRFDGR
jgi:sarcosine oxidase